MSWGLVGHGECSECVSDAVDGFDDEPGPGPKRQSPSTRTPNPRCANSRGSRRMTCEGLWAYEDAQTTRIRRIE